MDPTTAAELLRPIVLRSDKVWADIGAGGGVFSRALARLLGPEGVVYAVDRDRDAVRALKKRTSLSESRRDQGRIIPVLADLSQPLELPPLDGVLLANVLHYVPNAGQAATLERMASLLRAQGRLVVAEYDGRPANRWVPHPVSRARLRELARLARLSEPLITATRESAYGGVLYVAVLRPARRSVGIGQRS